MASPSLAPAPPTRMSRRGAAQPPPAAERTAGVHAPARRLWPPPTPQTVMRRRPRWRAPSARRRHHRPSRRRGRLSGRRARRHSPRRRRRPTPRRRPPRPQRVPRPQQSRLAPQRPRHAERTSTAWAANGVEVRLLRRWPTGTGGGTPRPVITPWRRRRRRAAAAVARRAGGALSCPVAAVAGPRRRRRVAARSRCLRRSGAVTSHRPAAAPAVAAAAAAAPHVRYAPPLPLPQTPPRRGERPAACRHRPPAYRPPGALSRRWAASTVLADSRCCRHSRPFPRRLRRRAAVASGPTRPCHWHEREAVL